MTEVMEPAVDPLSKATALAELLAKAIEELHSMKPQEKSNTEPESSVKKDSYQMQPQAQPRDEKSKFNPRGTSPFVVVQSGLTTFFDEPSDDGEVSEASQESSQRRSSFSCYDTTDSEDEDWKPEPRENPSEGNICARNLRRDGIVGWVRRGRE